MTDSSAKREGLGLFGLGAAACVACCAGPILAFLSGVTFTGAASTFVIGVAGLGLAAVAAAAWFTVRRRRRSGCPDVAIGEPVSIAPPSRRATM